MPDEVIGSTPPMLEATVRPIAPWPHTLALFVVLVASASLGRQHAAGIVNNAGHAARYGSTVMLSWLLLGSVVAGVYHRRAFFTAAMRGRTSSWVHEAALGVVVYLCGMITLAVVGGLTLLTPLGHQRNRAVVMAMMPHTLLEFAGWLCISVSAGFCEELIFRAYLLRQLTAWTRSPVLAVILTAATFGAMHLYEGLGAILPLMALALLYGFVVLQRRGDLRAVMVAHTLQDFLVAFLALSHASSHHRPHP